MSVSQGRDDSGKHPEEERMEVNSCLLSPFSGASVHPVCPSAGRFKTERTNVLYSGFLKVLHPEISFRCLIHMFGVSREAADFRCEAVKFRREAAVCRSDWSQQ